MNIKRVLKSIKTCVDCCGKSFSMAFILESVWEWAMAHVLGKCLSLQVPDEFGHLADPQTVYEHLYSNGVRN